MPSDRRVAWVTGGGRGIGRACAEALAKAGGDVAVSARNPQDLWEAANACRAAGARAFEAPCDVTDPAAVAETHARIAKELGMPLILVNSAGMAEGAPFQKTTADLMEAHWRLNVLGTFHCIQAALPAMLQARWGRIVNVASIAGKAGAPYITAYAASKHAVLGLTRSLAAEVGAKGVGVNAVCPGYVDTPMTDRSLGSIMKATGLDREAAMSRMLASASQSRLLSPEEVAAVVVELASAGSRRSGEAITLDAEGVRW